MATIKAFSNEIDATEYFIELFNDSSKILADKTLNLIRSSIGRTGVPRFYVEDGTPFIRVGETLIDSKIRN